MDASQWLVKVEFFVGAQQKALNSTDFCFSVGWNLQVDLLEANH